MAQVVKLKRTAVEGKVPSTSNLELGELAINTFDGRIFFEKDNGVLSIEQIVTTNSHTTGSINIIGNVTASIFFGNIQSTNGVVSGSSQLTASFDTRYINTNGDGVISGSSQITYSGISSIPSGIVSGSSQLTSSFDTRYINTNGDGVISGSSQITYSGISSIPSGIVSGSSQITTLLPSGVISGSSQLTASYDTRYLNTLGDGVISGSSQITYSGISSIPVGIVSGSSQVIGILSSLNTYTASNDTTNTTQNNRLTSLETASGSAITRLIVLEAETLNLELYTASNDTTNTTQNSRLTSLETASGSAITRLTALEIETSNLEAFTGSINTTIKTRLNAETVVSGSSQIVYTSLSSIPAGIVSGSVQVTPLLPTGVVSGSSQVNADSITNFDSNVKEKLDADGVLSGSVINGNKTFSNDVIVSGNLTVNGTTTTVNSNTVNIGDNILVLNSDETGTPSQNGGIEIERGTSTNASLIWNESNDQWQAGLSGSEISLVDVSSTQTLFNKTINGGNNTITNIGNVSLTNSSITIAGTSTALGGSITVATILQGTGVVSGSSQVSYPNLSNIPAGIVSGAAQITPLLPSGVVSGSSQLTASYDTRYLNTLGDGVVSGSSQITYSGISSIPIGIVSGSSQVTPLLPTGVVSGSSQLTSSFDTRYINTNGDGVVSGSSQITYSGISSIPAGIVSGSSQVTLLLPNGVISGSSQITNVLQNQSINLGTGAITASYFVGDGSQLTNLPAADVSQVATVTSSFDNQSTISVTHNFNTKNVIISVYENNDTQIIPSSVTLTNNNTATVVLSANHSGYIVVAKGGHIVSGSATDSSALNGQPGSYYLNYTNFTNIPSGIISGSTQITNLTTYAVNVNGNSTYTITHNLNEEYPIVQAWNTSTKRQELPSIIESTSVNALDVTFSGNFSGRIIVKK